MAVKGEFSGCFQAMTPKVDDHPEHSRGKLANHRIQYTYLNYSIFDEVRRLSESFLQTRWHVTAQCYYS